MTKFLLFDNENNSTSRIREERIELFAKTLNDAFVQFQSLWDDYKKALENSNKSEKNSPNILQEQQNVEKSDNSSAKKGMANEIPDKEFTAIENENTVDRDPGSLALKETEKPCEQSFQIFSQDFCTQSLEESFKDHNNSTTLQEIQNLTPKRSKSPIFSMKKRKSRRMSPIAISSPNTSEKSVVILNDFNDVTTSNSKSPCISKIRSNPTIVDDPTDAPPSLIHSTTSISKADTNCAPKSVKKWGISTMYNVDRNLTPGSKKKLKQSRLYVRKEKITDLSNCEDVTLNKFDDRRAAKTPDNTRDTNCSWTNDSCLEDSFVQASPNHETGVSKIRGQISRRIKNAETRQRRLNMVEKNLENSEGPEIFQNENGNTDNDITLFDPNLASTQYTRLPVHSSKSMNKTSVTNLKPAGLNEKVNINESVALPTDNSDPYDETLFIENQTPFDFLTLRKTKSEKREKTKRISLPKKTGSSVNLKKTSKNSLNEVEKESIDSEMEISLDNSQEIYPNSPVEKTTARSIYKPVPDKRCKSPTYVYKGSPVRKQAERARLNGWDCVECEKYYKATGLTGDELQKRKNECSRHRSKFNERKMSQKGYWNPDFTSSFNSTIWSQD